VCFALGVILAEEEKHMHKASNFVMSALLVSVFATPLAAQVAGDSVSLNTPSERDVYAAGRNVDVSATVAGDAVVAGQRVTISGAVRDDVLAAGEIVIVSGAVGDDVRAAGREVRLESSASGHVVAAGQNVSILRGVDIGQFAWLAGERVEMRGSIAEELRAAGEEVVIAGTVGGDADVAAERIVIDAGAVIGGDLIVYGDDDVDVEVNESARIGGQVITRPFPESGHEWDDDWMSFPGGLFVAVSVFVALAVLAGLFPGFLQRSAGALTGEPLKALGMGLAVLLVTPLVIVVLLAIGIGFLLALPLAAIYLVVLLIGYLAGLFTVAYSGARRLGFDVTSLGRRLLALALAVIVVMIISVIPYVGSLAVFVLWLAGMGACLLAWYRLYRTSSEPA
jgi:hypothetical protein